MNYTYLIPLLIVIFLIFFYITSYNRMLAARQAVKEAWSDVDVQLKRRHVLIPNIVTIVKKYSKHEKELFEEVTRLRTEAMALTDKERESLAKIEQKIGIDLSQILMIAEGYPDLKANTVFLDLQKELSRTEDQIASARRIYNSNTRQYNTMIAIFPLNLVAGIHQFTSNKYFQIDEQPTPLIS